MTVCVTGAAGQIGYAILPLICRGYMLGFNQRVWLNLLDIPEAQQSLTGVQMELQDCAFPLLAGITIGSDPAKLFQNCDVIIFVGGFPRKAGMERKELLSKNLAIFKAQGQALNAVGKPDVKCLVVANPANTNCLALATFAPRIPKRNFTCLTRLDMNRAAGQLAQRTDSAVYGVKNITIWGNHSATQYPDVNQATVGGQYVRNFLAHDEAWLNGDFISTVQKRGAAVIQARKLSSAMSAASAAVDHVRDWCQGTRPGEWVSMGVISDGRYGVPPGLVFSFPVTCQDFTWNIVSDLPIDRFSREKIEATTKELLEEKAEAELV
jgi:malate dehydrogenase